VATVLLLLIGAGVTVSIVTDDGGHHRVVVERHFVTIQQPPSTPSSPSPAPVVADTDHQFERDEQAEAAKSKADLAGNPDVHEDAVDETPPGVSPDAIATGRKFEAHQAATQLSTPAQPVGAQNYSCRAHPVANQSGLNGKRVGVALHFTVGGTIESVWQLFNRPSFGASSNYGISLTGRCEQWVPDSRKAWAQLTANSAYISIEITTNDLSRALRAIGAPAKLVDPTGCNWLAGVTDHNRLECGNSHWDVGEHFPWDVFMRQVRAGSATTPLTTPQKHACDLLNYHRRRAHQVGRWYPSRSRRANELKRQIPTGRCLSKYRKH
jgi:N-acetyl-anhydromuramyl-L-alanine amidase AmpD